MAKITPSALISQISGRLMGQVAQVWKGEIILRESPPPPKSRSVSQAKLRGLSSDYAGAYDSLNSAQKAEWEAYADAIADVMTGMDSYVRNNVRLIYADHGSLTAITNPPDPPAPPTIPAGFAVSYDGGDDEFDLEWTSPDANDLYVQASFSPQVGYNNTLFPKWKFAETVVSDVLIININAVNYSSPRYFRFRIRTIDPSGEISAWSSTLRANK